MITMQTVLKQLTGEEIYNSLIHLMTEGFADFAVIRKRYEHTMGILQTKLGEKIVTDTMEAIQQQTISNLLFCGCLGIKANLDNFLNPLTRNFLDVDPEIYLREETAHRLPEYERAQITLEHFYALISPGYQAQFEDVAAYISYLETAAPKLAHYCGYLLGNDLLPRIIPGYHTDMALTVRYQMMLRVYFGKEYALPLADT